jgi:uncharacterized protein YlxP (DUF503 family)
MHVGLLRVTLHIPAAHSLKDRRAVLRKAIDRLRARFNVSVAEVGDSAHWQRATIAVTVVSGDKSVIEEVLSKCTSTIANAGDAMITRRESEIVSYPDGETFGEDDLLATDASPAWSDDDGDDETQDR